jgi:hypothetical protein
VILVGATALIVAVATPSALAGSALLGVGDGLAITGSGIQCSVAANRGYGLDLRGKTYIVCGPSTGPDRGYVTLMDSTGHVYVLSIKTEKTVFSRKPTAIVRGTGMYTVKIGDVAIVKGTPIACLVVAVGGAPTLVCELVDAKGAPRANTYGFGISNAYADSLGWDAGRKVHTLKSFPER